MTEPQCRELIGAYALGALDPPEEAAVSRHLVGCARCRRALAEVEETVALLREVPPEVFLDGPADPGDLVLRRTLHQIRAESAGLARPPNEGRSTASRPVPLRPAGRPTAAPAIPGHTSRGVGGAPHPNRGAGGTPPGRSPASHSNGRPTAGRPASAGRPGGRKAVRPPRRFAMVAGVAVLAAGLLGGGLTLGWGLEAREDTPAASPSTATSTERPSAVAGLRLLTGHDPKSKATLRVEVTPADGWVRLAVTVTGISPGQRCRLVAVSSVGNQEQAASWQTSAEGGEITGSASIPIEDLAAVSVLTEDGHMLVTAVA